MHIKVQDISNRIKFNWRSGLTVALVSIPLSISLAVASGASPITGIVTAVWAGLGGAFWGGSHYNIIGPAGALSGILLSYALQYGSSVLPTLAIIAGVFVLVASVFNLERYLSYIPNSTIYGFTLGVALIIGLGQLNYALGLKSLPRQALFVDNLLESLRHLTAITWSEFLFFTLCLSSLFILTRYIKKIPAVIILTPLGLLMGFFSYKGLGFNLALLGQKFTNLTPAIMNLSWPRFSLDLFGGGIVIGVVAILETMLSAKLADKMTDTKFIPKSEMRGLGLANLFSGLLGGLPATGVLVRTAINVKNGANHKTSGILNALFIGVMTMLFISYFRYLPLSAMAAILVFAALRMVEISYFIKMFKFDKKSFAIAMVVSFITVYHDPIMGILAGSLLSLLVLVEQISSGPCELTVSDVNYHSVKRVTAMDSNANWCLPNGSHDIVYSIKGELAYLDAEIHRQRLEKLIEQNQNIVLRLRELHHIDLDGLEMLDDFICKTLAKHSKLAITGVNPSIEKVLMSSRYYRKMVKEKMVFAKATEALISFKPQIV